MCVGVRKQSMRKCKSIAECLADEIILCAKNSPDSYTIGKKIEVEKNAKANRWLLFMNMINVLSDLIWSDLR